MRSARCPAAASSAPRAGARRPFRRPSGRFLLGAALLLIPGPASAAAPASPPAPSSRPAEAAPPRNLVVEPGAPVPWKRHVDLGAGAAVVARLGDSGAGGEPTLDLAPGAGFELHARIPLLRFLQFEAYLVRTSHDLEAQPGALRVPPGTRIATGDARAYSFGVRLCPTLPLGPRAKAWVLAGIGWGRFEYGRMTFEPPGAAPFLVRERADSLVELPLGLGASVTVLPRWLSVDAGLVFAPLLEQNGSALQEAQAIESGAKRSVGGLAEIDASLVATLGLSLLL